MQELSLNVLDVAQNSVRAQASLIEISVEVDTARDKLFLEIRDNGCGMSEEQAAKVADPFFTTRTTRKVGLGVSFLKMAAEMTQGSFSIQSEQGIGTKVHADFGLSHIDRMPLGDMAGTMTALIQCNSERDFVYRFRCGEREFSADTRQFRQVLEGVPLSEPEVLGFIGSYINENTQDALNGVLV